MSDELALLHQKVDYLTEQLETQQKQFRVVQELKDDMLPIANDFFRLSIKEFAEIGDDFQVEDWAYLLKQTLRKAKLMTRTLERLESLMELVDEVELLGTRMVSNFSLEMSKLEKTGYFALAQEGRQVADQVVAELKPEDVHLLGDQLVQVIQALREVPADQDVSIPSLLKQFSDIKVRRGMGRLLNILKVLGEGS